MDKAIERTFRFIEMIAITALIKAVIVPAYPVTGGFAVGLLTIGATAYLVSPLLNYCQDTLLKNAKDLKTILMAVAVPGALFMIIQVLWLQPLVTITSELIKATISVPRTPHGRDN